MLEDFLAVNDNIFNVRLPPLLLILSKYQELEAKQADLASKAMD